MAAALSEYKYRQGYENWEDKHLCPVCGKHWFEEYGSFDYCPVCGWQDDNLETCYVGYEGGANGMTVEEYRERWKNGDPECQPFDDDEEDGEVGE